MKEFLLTFQLVVSILLSLVILSQEKSSGLSSVFGGTGSFHRGKRGAEKVLSMLTVILAVLFIVTSFSFIFVQ